MTESHMIGEIFRVPKTITSNKLLALCNCLWLPDEHCFYHTELRCKCSGDVLRFFMQYPGIPLLLNVPSAQSNRSAHFLLHLAPLSWTEYDAAFPCADKPGTIQGFFQL